MNSSCSGCSRHCVRLWRAASSQTINSSLGEEVWAWIISFFLPFVKRFCFCFVVWGMSNLRRFANLEVFKLK